MHIASWHRLGVKIFGRCCSHIVLHVQLSYWVRFWFTAGTVLFLLIHPSALLSLSFIPSTFVYLLSCAQRLLFSLFFLSFSFYSTSLALSSFWRLDLSYRGIFRLLSILFTFSPPRSHTYCRPPASIMHLKRRRLKDRRLGLPSLEFFNIN